MRWVYLLVVLVIGSPCWAQEPLKAADVQRFIASYGELKPLLDAADAGDEAAENPSALATSWGKVVAQNVQARAILAKHGLSEAAWASLADVVLRTYMVLKMSEGGAAPLAQLRQSLVELEADTSIPANLKPEMVANYRQAIAQYEAMEKSVSAADKTTVRPFVPQLDGLLEWTDQ
jgi:hypothetical protein